MKHFILGTAGHVDHGKTSLIKALTGIDCDTHPEEKRRGITINLGFAHLDLGSELCLGVIDVPGHRDFVHTMVGGASGLDLAMLVIAADGGVMPQTREHLNILDALGVRGGLVVINKMDLADPEMLPLVLEEISDLTRGTFLENAPLCRVSALSGEGLDGLKSSIAALAGATTPRLSGHAFRMYIDRAFSVSGFGPVVTGSVISGALGLDSRPRLLPGGHDPLRIRRLERHGRETEEVLAGDRASINLVGLPIQAYGRGMVISDRALPATTMMDARLRLFPSCPRVGLWSRVAFHLGTFECQARMHLLDCDGAAGGDTVLVQVHLEQETVMQQGDRFVIRRSSGDSTMGGGEVLDVMPLHHRRRTEKVAGDVGRLAAGGLSELVAGAACKRYRPVCHDEIAVALNVSEEDVLRTIAAGMPQTVASYHRDGRAVLMVKSRHGRLRERLCRAVEAHHGRNPLKPGGLSEAELMGKLDVGGGSSGEFWLECLLREMEAEGILKQVENTWALNSHRVRMDDRTQALLAALDGHLRASGMQTPLMSELQDLAGKKGVDGKELDRLLRFLMDQRRAYNVDGNYLHAETVDRCRIKLLSELARRKEGMTVADFRTLVDGNRKICLLMLALFDGEGVTRRSGDDRLITPKGRDFLAKAPPGG